MRKVKKWDGYFRTQGSNKVEILESQGRCTRFRRFSEAGIWQAMKLGMHVSIAAMVSLSVFALREQQFSDIQPEKVGHIRSLRSRFRHQSGVFERSLMVEK